MKKQAHKKLLLSVQRVRELQASRLKPVAGGLSLAGCDETDQSVMGCKTTKLICNPSDCL